MFRHLLEIDERLYERYLTVEKNIKSASNSFYDSYLDLQEQLVKWIVVECSYEIKLQETCGAILKKQEVTTKTSLWKLSPVKSPIRTER